MENILLALSHWLIGFFFAFYGFWNIYHWSPIIQIMIQKRIPHAWLVLAVGIAWQVFAGCLIIFGLFVSFAALSLIPFTLIAVIIFHPFWQHRGESRALNLAIFMGHITMTLSALLLLIVQSWSH